MIAFAFFILQAEVSTASPSFNGSLCFSHSAVSSAKPALLKITSQIPRKRQTIRHGLKANRFSA
ncbi:MAG: hypothetical protein LIP11_04065, partial [Clostridiales bacterium]|nr:hypothetical protein [Clostridiales bacterium]